MAAHRWWALGSAPMTTMQAQGWLAAPPEEPISDSLSVWFASVACEVCLDDPEQAPPTCPGPPDEAGDHAWMTLLTAPITEGQLATWEDGEQPFQPGFPRSIAVVCVLCGQAATDSATPCPERTSWTRNDPTDLTVDDVVRPGRPDSDDPRGPDAQVMPPQ